MDAVPGAGEDEELDPRQPISTNDPVTLFVSIVKESWNTQLRQDTYISRYYACCIRNIIRHHMTSFKFNTVAEFYEQALNYDTLIKSRAISSLMSYNNGEFAELLQQIHNESLVDTVGKYIAFLTMFLLTTSKERINIEKGDIDKIYETVKRIRHRYINRVARIHVKYRCKSMFIGIPCYMFPDDSGFEEILNWGSNMLSRSYMVMYKSYIEYLKQNPRNPGDDRTLMLSFSSDTWYFNNSIPEYVLKGLCFRHDDMISTEKDVKVRFYLKHLIGNNQYVYYEVNTKTSYIKFPSNIGVKNDAFAVAIEESDDNRASLDLISPTYRHPFYTIDKFPPGGLVKLDKGGVVPEDDRDKESDNLPADEDPIDDGGDDDDDDYDDYNEELDNNGNVLDKEDKKRGDLGPLRKQALKRLERRLNRIEQDHVEVAKSCSIVAEAIDRLERHADTLRQSMVNLAKKIDYQTGYITMYPE
ncbi:SWPV1-238 [Shearwaterpox virus]|uniref:SWPV1-238 n=1 Tax=Shearwaterpox virus TaxID=1974596 RepID=A0A1V0S845_CNPV|nr:SWPV1-238 [Shearwaterpox virus]